MAMEASDMWQWPSMSTGEFLELLNEDMRKIGVVEMDFEGLDDPLY